jgi:hypothetical protein
MYISARIALVRNVAVASLNGAIALIILLIAPLGLAAVITTVVLITIASLINSTASDRVILFLQSSEYKNNSSLKK